jgi:hypothetical protein
VPERLFDAINLPMLTVKWPKENNWDKGTKDEDIALLFGVCAPGNVTRRFGNVDAHWVLPATEPRAPLMRDLADYDNADQLPLLNEVERKQLNHDERLMAEELLSRLPVEVRRRLVGKQHLYYKLYRPDTVTLQKAGAFGKKDANWTPAYFWDAAHHVLVPPDALEGRKLPGIHHKSRSVLLGFPLLTTAPGRAKERTVRGLERLAQVFVEHTGGAKQQGTGLSVVRAFWGVEVRLRLDELDEDKVVWTTVFTDPQGEQPALHGYALETEGIRLTPNSQELDTFLNVEIEALKQDKGRNRWLRGQFFRYLLATRLAGEKLDSLASALLADLLIAANDDPVLSARLKALYTNWDGAVFRQLLQDAREAKLSDHPHLSAERVEKLAVGVPDNFAALVQGCLNEVMAEGPFRGYLRSLVLHGLALSLHELFVLHGRGDERQVMIHARLPVQFGDKADDTISVFEGGDHGDGTTRTFRQHAVEAFASWRRGELAECPYAAEDALVECLFADTSRHAAWLAMDPADPDTMPRIARELTGTRELADMHLQSLRRVLFEVDTVGGEEFRLYHLHAAMRKVRLELEATSGLNLERGSRPPTAWELVSAGMRAARDAAKYPVLARLLAAYQGLTKGQEADAPPAEARLADQLFRLSASLCLDGCLACLHRPSSLMPDPHTALSVSRGLLRSYREYLLAPLTLCASEHLPTANEVARRLREYGACRLFVTPARYDGWKEQLAALGFHNGEFDPVARMVVCLLEGTT